MSDFDDKVKKRYDELKDTMFNEIYEQLSKNGFNDELGPAITVVIKCQIRALALHEVRTLERIDQLLTVKGE